MAITKADVLLVAPELSTLSDDAWTALIADAYLELNATVWDLRLDLGAKYLVAHKATLLSRRGTPLVSSQTVGPVSVTYAASPSDADAGGLESTPYGREYRRLLRVVAPRIMVL